MIRLVPMGEIEDYILSGLREALAEAFAEGAEPWSSMPLPPSAYNSKRGQHQASEIIYSVARLPRQGERLLGVADVDIYSPGLNFVFGLAAPGIQTAVISLTRLRPEYHGQPPDKDLLLERTVKEAVHEVGHLLTLGHCPDPGCVMAFSNSLEDTDRKGRAFCPRHETESRG
ncbi:MAG TPA: archaemetzincin family Zn-dependent metalloprotease [Dehalococcoidia bacterium]|nr:archaemetzincin family Zn-dependent metalloprotease [Dehalococcoidia bacterium]